MTSGGGGSGAFQFCDQRRLALRAGRVTPPRPSSLPQAGCTSCARGRCSRCDRRYAPSPRRLRAQSKARSERRPQARWRRGRRSVPAWPCARSRSRARAILRRPELPLLEARPVLAAIGAVRAPRRRPAASAGPLFHGSPLRKSITSICSGRLDGWRPAGQPRESPPPGQQHAPNWKHPPPTVCGLRKTRERVNPKTCSRSVVGTVKGDEGHPAPDSVSAWPRRANPFQREEEPIGLGVPSNGEGAPGGAHART